MNTNSSKRVTSSNQRSVSHCLKGAVLMLLVGVVLAYGTCVLPFEWPNPACGLRQPPSPPECIKFVHSPGPWTCAGAAAQQPCAQSSVAGTYDVYAMEGCVPEDCGCDSNDWQFMDTSAVIQIPQAYTAEGPCPEI